MRDRRIALAIGLLLVAALIGGGLACGSKTASPTGGIGLGDPAPFGDGSWELRYTITATAGDPSCADANGSFVDTFTVAGGQVSDFIGSNCTFVVGGTHFSQNCRDTFVYSVSCRFIVTISGSGEAGGDTFTAVYAATVAPLGDCASFPVPSCTLRIVATGTRFAPTAARLSTRVPGVRVRSVPEGIERLAVRRAFGPAWSAIGVTRLGTSRGD